MVAVGSLTLVWYFVPYDRMASQSRVHARKFGTPRLRPDFVRDLRAMRCLPMLVALAAAAAALQPVHDARGDGFLSGKVALPDDLLEVVECIEDAVNAQLASPMLLCSPRRRTA